jgi:hypothetical protein
MNRARRPPLEHPLAGVFDRAVDSLTAALNPDTARHYRGTARNFLSYLGANHPDVDSLRLLCRQPHILGWMSHLRAQAPAAGHSLLHQPADHPPLYLQRTGLETPAFRSR